MKNYYEVMLERNIFTDANINNFIKNVRVEDNNIIVEYSRKKEVIPYSKETYDKYMGILKNQAQNGRKILPKLKINRMRLVTFALSLLLLSGLVITRLFSVTSTLKFILDISASIMFSTISLGLINASISISKTITDIEKNTTYLKIEKDLEETFSNNESSIFIGLTRKGKDIILESNPIHVGFDNLERLSLEDLMKLRENLINMKKEEVHAKKMTLMPISKVK